MEISGKVFLLLQPQTGTGKNGQWKKQDFVIETTDAYPKKVCFTAWGDKIDLNKLKTGEQVKVLFDVESREYNGKWYSDLKAYGLQTQQGSSAPDQVDNVNIPDQDDLPI